MIFSVLVISEELAEGVWERLVPILGGDDVVNLRPVGFGNEGYVTAALLFSVFSVKECLLGTECSYVQVVVSNEVERVLQVWEVQARWDCGCSYISRGYGSLTYSPQDAASLPTTTAHGCRGLTSRRSTLSLYT